MHEEIGQAALDGFEIAETRVGGVEPFDQLRDAVFEMAERRVIGVRELDPFELLDESGQQLLKLARHGVARFGRGVQRIGERVEAAFERGNGLPARRAIGESRRPSRPATARPRRPSSRCRWTRHARRSRASAPIAVSSCCSVAGSSLPMIRSTFCDSVRTASSKPTRFSAGVRLCSASRTSASPRSSPASADEVDAGIAGMIDPLRQRLDFDLKRFHRMARQRFGESGGRCRRDLCGRPL